MAYSAADLSATEIALAALDKPILSNNALYNTSNNAKWVRGTRAGVVGSTEEEDTDYPTENLFDGYPSNVSKPNASEQDFTIVLDRSSAPITFDWLGIINHNLDTLGATIFDLEVDDDPNFLSPEKISTTNIATSFTKDQRFTDLVLESGGGTARRYTDVPYIRIGIQIPSSDIPEIGQIVLGRRRQQQYQPDLEWNPTHEITEVDDMVSRSGVVNRVARHKARRQIDATWRHSTDAEQTDILNWWSDIEAAEQPFFLLDEPNTNPHDFWMMFMEPAELDYSFIMHNTRELKLSAMEQGAAFFALE